MIGKMLIAFCVLTTLWVAGSIAYMLYSAYDLSEAEELSCVLRNDWSLKCQGALTFNQITTTE